MRREAGQRLSDTETQFDTTQIALIPHSINITIIFSHNNNKKTCCKRVESNTEIVVASLLELKSYSIVLHSFLFVCCCWETTTINSFTSL